MIIIFGIILSILSFLKYVISNKYIQYKMFGLVIHNLKVYVDRWSKLIFTLIIVVLILSIIEANLRQKSKIRTVISGTLYLAFISYGGWAINHYWLPHKFHPYSILGNIGIVIFAMILGWNLIKSRLEKLLRLTRIKYIERIAIFIVSAIIILNLGILIKSRLETFKGPNVILIGIDTLRADHLMCYGYKRDTSPGMDKLAKESIQFSQCLSHIPATTPSFASLLTSKRPLSHGVLDNNYEGYKLDNKHITLAEILKNAGYKTAAFVSGSTLKKNANLTQGFDKYDDKFAGLEQNAESVSVKVIKWLEKNKKRKFFLFIHYFDPHGKYNAPPPYNNSFVFSSETHDAEKIPSYQKHDDISDPSFYIAQYDGEIRYTDYHIDKLIDKIYELNLNDATLMILTSDHGETMSEHEWWFDHGSFVYEEQIHVPLLFWYPRMFSHDKIDALIRHIDVLPSVLDILGINLINDFEGHSILPLIKKDHRENNQFIYCESGRGSPWKHKNIIEGIQGKQFAIRSENWKLIRIPYTTGVEYELYDLNNDPKELCNLIGKDFPVETQLKTKLDGYVERYKASSYYRERIDKSSKLEHNDKNKERKKLKALGYIK